MIPGLDRWPHPFFRGVAAGLPCWILPDSIPLKKFRNKLPARARELPEGTPHFRSRVLPLECISRPGMAHETDPGARLPPNIRSSSTAGGGRALWVNSLALKISGIDGKSEAPPGGEIVKDPKTGEPTGILKEAAGRLLKVEMKSTPRAGHRKSPEAHAQPCPDRRFTRIPIRRRLSFSGS